MADLTFPHAFVSAVSSKVASLPRLRTEPASRRPVHGGSWSLPAEELRQPQDGAVRFRSEPRAASIRAFLPGGSLQDPEDARLTGSTRSLSRRLLGLNLAAVSTMGSTLRKAPAMAAKAVTAVVPKTVPQPRVA